MKPIFFFLLTFVVLDGCMAQKTKESAIFTNSQGAIKGYDPVAFFTESKAIKGADSLIFEWNGAVWHFQNEENRQAFISNPETYAPQYGGYCAYGWSRGYAAPTEPDAWTIVDGKLYLNYNLDVKAEWEKDKEGYIRKADENYHKKK
jgi:YHS domain-containing protein